MTNSREYSVHEPQAKADASVIWLHGLGADGSDFMGIVDQLGLPEDHSIRFVFPNAPYLHVTVNQGMRMRAWYDIYDLNILRKEDERGAEKSRFLLQEIIQHQIDQGIAAQRIILAGFSQGGAMALYTGLRYAQALGGIISLSAYLPMAAKFNAEEYPVNAKIPIFIAHGMFDPVVPYSAGKNTCEYLIEQNYSVDWHSYPIVHTVAFEELHSISTFIARCLYNA
jgi:phospholipase/carboxylesterase